MNARIYIEQPDEVQLTLAVTMPLGHWRELQKQIGTGWPAVKLHSAIDRLITKATTGYTDAEEFRP